MNLDNILPEEIQKKRLRLWIRMLHCTTRIENQVRRRLRQRFGITLPQFDLLATLDRAREPMTMTQLSESLLVTNGNVTGVVQRLAAQDWLRLYKLPRDRRSHMVSLTNSGRERFTKMAAEHRGWITELLSGSEFHEDDLEEMLKQVGRELPKN